MEALHIFSSDTLLHEAALNTRQAESNYSRGASTRGEH